MSDQVQHQTEESLIQSEEPAAQVNQQQASSTEELQRQIEDLKVKAEENLNGWKRAMADLSNYKKQTEEEKKSWAMFSLMGSISQFLPVLDTIHSALAAQPPLESTEGPFKQFLIGLVAIKKQFEDALTQMGVVEAPGVGSVFDPLVHESVSKEGEVTGKGELVVLQVLIKGYLVQGQLVRPAKVVVKEVVGSQKSESLSSS